jgi:DNA-binding transcriptional ArsR family regulator
LKDGPDLARIANLVGDPARANMLTALMTGTALTASELALEAGIGLPTASSHLTKLLEGGLLTVASEGRHRYYGLAGPQVAGMLEAIMGVAATLGPKRVRPGPREATMREARVCYDHLAGEHAVKMLDGFLARGFLRADGGDIQLSEQGMAHFSAIGIEVGSAGKSRRPVCRTCLDWSVRRSHLAGTLGAAILDKIIAEKWARREKGSRVVTFSPKGKMEFSRVLLGA